MTVPCCRRSVTPRAVARSLIAGLRLCRFRNYFLNRHFSARLQKVRHTSGGSAGNLPNRWGGFSVVAEGPSHHGYLASTHLLMEFRVLFLDRG